MAKGGTPRMADEETGTLGDVVPLGRRTLHSELVERVRDMIIEGHLAPGTRVHEEALGARFGVSRTPLREALRSLASEGLVELVPGRGALVRALTPTDVREMLDVLSALEALAGRAACRNATEAEVRGLRALHDAMMDFYARRDRLEYYKRNQAFHTGVVQAAHNRTLAAQHETLQARLKRIRFIGNASPEKWAAAAAEHEEMVAALEARDAERLAAVLVLHMERTWERVRDSL